MNKLVTIIFLLLWMPLYGAVNSFKVESNVPIGLSLNIGMPAMKGCQSVSSNSEMDCWIHRLGIAPINQGNAVILGKAKGGYAIRNYDVVMLNQLYYTNYHVNGYFASTNPTYTFMRFGWHQPLTSVSGITKSGYSPQYYTYTAADYIIFSQNSVVSIDFLKVFINALKAASLVKPYNYSAITMAFNNAWAVYLMSKDFYNYSCSSGNLLGGSLPLIHSQSSGMTEFQNYVFDAATLYKNSIYGQNNYDVLSSALRVDPQVALANNTNNQSLQIDVVTFQNCIAGTKVNLSDYFNGVGDSTLAVYIPLHLVDPGTTYVGTDMAL